MRGGEQQGGGELRYGASRILVTVSCDFRGCLGGSHRLLAAPVGGIEQQVEEKSKDGRKLDIEMRRFFVWPDFIHAMLCRE